MHNEGTADACTMLRESKPTDVSQEGTGPSLETVTTLTVFAQLPQNVRASSTALKIPTWNVYLSGNCKRWPR